MSDFVGVIHPIHIFISGSIKQEALMFDRIGVPINLRTTAGSVYPPESLLTELEWLRENRIVFEPDVDLSSDVLTENNEYLKFTKLESRLASEAANLIFRKAPKKPRMSEASVVKFVESVDYHMRRLCIGLRELSGIDAYPIINTPFIKNPSIASQIDVIEIVLNALPIPNGLTSWEQILEYRSDPDSKGKFLDIRNWMNQVARNDLSPIEIEQKLEYLMSQYQRHMTLHKMKTNAGALETVTVSSAEFLEDLVKFKWGKIAKGLFSLKHRRIALMEGELTSPGSEVAYIVKAREKFSS